MLAFFLFPDFPETSSWLSDEERILAVERIRGVASLGHAKVTWQDAKATLLDWRLYLHYWACISFCCAFSCVSLFIPTIVSGLGYQGLSAQLFSVPPYAIAFVVTVVVGWQADKRGIRSWCAFTCFVVAGLSFVAQGTHVPYTSFIISGADCPLRRFTVPRFQSTICVTLRRCALFFCDKSSPAELVGGKCFQHWSNDVSFTPQSIFWTAWTASG